MYLKQTVRFFLILSFVALSASPVRTADADEPSDDAVLRSPRLVALARELDAGNREALATFWQQVKGNAPLVEPVAGDPRYALITFLWRGDAQTERVALVGGLPGDDFSKTLSRLGDTDLWYRTETHSVAARFEYEFWVNAPEVLPWNRSERAKLLRPFAPRRDPLARRSFDGASYLELPGAPPQPWIVRRANVPRGTLKEQTFKSKILNAAYPLTLYTPPGYDPKGRRCWLMIAFDAGFPLMEVTLDNLLAAGKIPPLVVVGVGNISPGTRHRDLGGYEPFARFLVHELVPWARQRFRVYPETAHTIVGGISRGGLMAVYCGLKHADVFGKVLSQSGVVTSAPGQTMPNLAWEEEAPGLLARQFATSPRRPVEFYLEIGRYETSLRVSWLYENRRLRDVLKAKGYRVTYSEFVGGHNGVCWRGSFADAVMALTRRPNPKRRSPYGRQSRYVSRSQSVTVARNRSHSSRL